MTEAGFQACLFLWHEGLVTRRGTTQMSDDPTVAFAPLEARTEKTPLDAAQLDRISLRDHVRSVEIGAFQAERGVPQRLRFNLVVEVQTLAGALADDVDQVVSYDALTDAIDIALGDARLDLLETLAERIAALVLQDPRAARIFVRIEKLDRGPFALGVEIARRSGEVIGTGTGLEAPPLQVLLVPHDIKDRLKPALDALAEEELPAVLVALPDPALSLPEADHALARRRIALLGLDQAAWVLGGRDPRCLVVSSRTEIEWAAQQGQMTVCAPSKIVVDAVDGAPEDVADAEAVAAWLAETLGAGAVRHL
jgi:7,8-dihydroneopterin aldolase/epimerase/oxygenase